MYSPIGRGLKDRVKGLTDRRRCPVPLDDVVDELNASLRGWSGFFHFRNSSNVFRNVKMQAEERLRSICADDIN
ncbi:MAG: hypothetical protein GY785_16540 [Gammaproteobacteria bacterium]|nr:hypothetical protein [Gammaproteobacteria bacterium]